ncbi:MAG TPA: hypothetical protein VKC56_00400, partial [Gallionellaceae bacterium]|nr:hypothetical protein [Gallionellaceae bacterium]
SGAESGSNQEGNSSRIPVHYIRATLATELAHPEALFASYSCVKNSLRLHWKLPHYQIPENAAPQEDVEVIDFQRHSLPVRRKNHIPPVLLRDQNVKQGSGDGYSNGSKDGLWMVALHRYIYASKQEGESQADTDPDHYKHMHLLWENRKVPNGITWDHSLIPHKSAM